MWIYRQKMPKWLDSSFDSQGNCDYWPQKQKVLVRNSTGYLYRWRFLCIFTKICSISDLYMLFAKIDSIKSKYFTSRYYFNLQVPIDLDEWRTNVVNIGLFGGNTLHKNIMNYHELFLKLYPMESFHAKFISLSDDLYFFTKNIYIKNLIKHSSKIKLVSFKLYAFLKIMRLPYNFQCDLLWGESWS